MVEECSQSVVAYWHPKPPCAPNGSATRRWRASWRAAEAPGTRKISQLRVEGKTRSWLLLRSRCLRKQVSVTNRAHTSPVPSPRLHLLSPELPLDEFALRV